LIGWGDPVLAWHAISQGLAESELIEGVLTHLRAQPKTAAEDARVLQAALARGRVLDRWFRTGGTGVVGVWTGPLPGSNGEPKAPRESAELVANADADEFAAALNDPIRNHFNNAKSDTLTVVAYSDGSTRMIVNRPGRPALKYAANAPASGTSTMQMYEGRFSVEGRIAYATLAFGQGQTIAPPEVDMVNVRQLAKGALLSADLDDGVTLTPLLLRRASRLIDAP
jgi:hypothetical protein